MTRYISARLVEAAGLLLVMSFAVYLLIGLMPGDPADIMIAADPRVTSADVARIKALYGLDQPLWARYVSWLGAALTGDFGNSRLHLRPVLEVMGPFLANSLLLMGASFVLSVIIALPAGIYAAVKPHSKLDHIINLLCFAGISLPAFWLALMLMMAFSVWLGWLPAGGIATPGGGGFLDRLAHLVLPVATLTLSSIGHYTRFVRAAMIETLRQDYIRTARAKGASPARVLWGHALRNALIPVVTILALSFGSLFSGALVTETMFAYPGMGKMIYDAIMGNDYNLALVGLLFATLVTLLGNLGADVAYVGLDPRIKLSTGEARR
ncbi:MAG TPA: ABC transporter permease [Alphaproteobacteria bacterium]|nr:ABC transporter permease [Alphaproteobacteria bacterium]